MAHSSRKAAAALGPLEVLYGLALAAIRTHCFGYCLTASFYGIPYTHADGFVIEAFRRLPTLVRQAIPRNCPHPWYPQRRNPKLLRVRRTPLTITRGRKCKDPGPSGTGWEQ